MLETEQQESRTSQLDDLLIEKLECAFDKPTQAIILHDVAKIASEHSAIDLAHAASRIPPHARAVLFRNLADVEEKISFMINTGSSTRIAVLREIGDEQVKELIEHMPPDEAVEVLEDLSERRYRKVIDMLEPSRASQILEIEKNARNTAGRLMTSEFFAFPMDIQIGQAAGYIRNHPGIDLTHQIFVLGQAGEILGYVPSRNLMVNPPHLPLRQVMRPVLHKVTAEVSRDEVVDLVERYKIPALPVVDASNHLIGIITYEDVLDAMGDILDETIGSMAGTTEKVSEYEPSLKRFLSRSPWLIVTMCAGLINVGVISSFDRAQQGLLTFALFFIPLITGMSGNIGIQCSTVLVRSMALGMITPGNRRGIIFKELLMGGFIGLVFGLLCGIFVYFFNFVAGAGTGVSPFAVGLLLSVGLFGACATGTLLGVFSPFLFARIGVDPAVASGPIVTAFNDFLSMSIYFLIAVGISRLIF